MCHKTKPNQYEHFFIISIRSIDGTLTDIITSTQNEPGNYRVLHIFQIYSHTNGYSLMMHWKRNIIYHVKTYFDFIISL